jgi:hypothetical protein
MTDAKYWADNYLRLQKLNARNRPKPKQETKPAVTHPLLLHPSNAEYAREAERVVAELAAQRRREWEAKQGPHPLVVGPLAQIPIRERPKQQRRSGATTA